MIQRLPGRNLVALLSLMLGCAPVPALAHGGGSVEAGSWEVRARAALSWRSDGAVDDYAFWRIPGIQMGGEAWPAESGGSVDDAQLSARYVFTPGWAVDATLSSHEGGQDHGTEVALEHLLLTWQGRFAGGQPTLRAGLMNAAFSPAASWHSASVRFSEAPLLADAFWGRHFVDKGAALAWHHDSGLSAGVEFWQGQAWPATDGQHEGSSDVWLAWRWQADQWQVGAGGWAMTARADRRADDRYSGGHNHSDPLNPLPADVRFSGDTDLAGGWLDLRWRPDSRVQVSLLAELASAALEGQVLDATRAAGLEADQAAWYVQPALDVGRHGFAVRHEGLILENHLSGAAAAGLATDGGLVSDADDPVRTSVQWRWSWRPGLILRSEYVLDDTLAQERDRVMIGLVWRQDWQGKFSRTSGQPDPAPASADL